MIKIKNFFLKEEIETMRDIATEKDFISEDESKKEIKKLREHSSTNPLVFCKLFITCYDYFYDNSSHFNKKIIKYLDFFNEFAIDSLRDHLSTYEDKDSFLGDFYNKGYIKTRISMYKEHYDDLIKLFFQVFDVE